MATKRDGTTVIIVSVRSTKKPKRGKADRILEEIKKTPPKDTDVTENLRRHLNSARPKNLFR